MGGPMSRVQSIERAFAVLAALGDGPAGRHRYRRPRRPPEVHRRPDAGLARAGGRRGAGARRDALPPWSPARDPGLRPSRRSGPCRDRPPDPGAARGRDRRGGRPVGARRSNRPLHRPGGLTQPGPGSRLDRLPDSDACGLVGPGLPRPLVAIRARPIPGRTARGVHAGHAHERGGAPRATAGRAARGTRLGARRVRRRDHVGRGTHRRPGWGDRCGPARARPDLSVPARRQRRSRLPWRRGAVAAAWIGTRLRGGAA